MSHATDETERFFSDLPSFDRFVECPDSEHYARAPRSWLLVVTDVVGSTRAIEAGRYKDVNAVGVASIVAIRNALPSLELPYVFGGDGATLLVPDSARPELESALGGVQRLAQTAFDLELRAGVVPLRELFDDGFEVSVAKLRVSPSVSLAMLSGSGISEGERRVKDPQRRERYAISVSGNEPVDLTGLECRWQPVPNRHGTILSLLVLARPKARRESAAIYRAVLLELEALLGNLDRARPVAAESLKLGILNDGFDQEARLASGRASGLAYGLAAARVRALAAFGRWLVSHGRVAGTFDGATYRDAVVLNTDFRKFDDTLRMVLDVTPVKVELMQRMLERERTAGRLFYGLHTSDASYLTCVVGSYADNHVHFVDGSAGGYALAAKQLKDQIRRA